MFVETHVALTVQHSPVKWSQPHAFLHLKRHEESCLLLDLLSTHIIRTTGHVGVATGSIRSFHVQHQVL